MILIGALAVLMLTGCEAATEGMGGAVQGTGEAEALSVVSTIFPQYDFVRAIAGKEGSIDNHMLLSPGEEVHSYEPSPQDIIRIQKADLLIYTGGENDVWIEDILDSMGEDGPQTFRLMDQVELIDEEIIEGMQIRGHDHGDEEEEDHDHETEDHLHEEEAAHVHEEEAEHLHENEGIHFYEESTDTGGEVHLHEEEPDEHVWTDPGNAAILCEKLAETLALLDPAHAEVYKDNAAQYVQQLQELDEQFQALVEQGKRREIVFGDRFPLVYFAKAYGLTYYAAFHGCSADAEASAATLSFLVDKVREDEIPAVFSIELSNGRIAAVIGEETGAKPLTFNTCHNLTKEQFARGDTYIDLMKENLEVLAVALY